MKKKFVYLFIFTTLIITIVSVAFLKKTVLSGEDKLSYTVKKAVETEKSGSNEVVANVNGIPIYKKELEIAQLFEKLRFDNKVKASAVSKQSIPVDVRQKTEKELLNEIIERKVLMDLAKKEGYLVSEEEAKAYFDSVEKTLDDILSGKIKGDVNSAKQAKEVLNTYRAQFSEDEFNKKIISAYQEILTVGKYLNAKVEKYLKENPNATPDEVNKFINDFKNKLKSDSKIEILDSKLQ